MFMLLKLVSCFVLLSVDWEKDLFYRFNSIDDKYYAMYRRNNKTFMATESVRYFILL